MYNDILAKIEALSSGFSKGQKLIASYILNHFDRAAYMTASKLGEEAGVSESTVVRFANELGLSGYPQLQGEIRESVRKRLTSVQRIALANDRLRGEDIPAAVLSADMENIRYTMENLDREAFDRATSAILEAKNIYIIGMRSSACLAEFMNHYLSLVFDNVRLVRSAYRTYTRRCDDRSQLSAIQRAHDKRGRFCRAERRKGDRAHRQQACAYCEERLRDA